MKIVERRESLEPCAKAGWRAFDCLLDEPIDRGLIRCMEPLGKFRLLPFPRRKFFLVEGDGFELKGVEGAVILRMAAEGEKAAGAERLFEEAAEKRASDAP